MKTSINMKTIYGFSAVVIILLAANGLKYIYSEESINSVIKEGLDQCGTLQNNNCKAVMMTLNNICQVAFFPSCFGDQWLPTMEELEKIYKHQNMDDYVTVNNEHYNPKN